MSSIGAESGRGQFPKQTPSNDILVRGERAVPKQFSSFLEKGIPGCPHVVFRA